MKKLFWVAAAWLLATAHAADIASAPAFRRFVLVAGTNDGGAGRVKLRYAASDAVAFAKVLSELGGVKPQDLVLLQEPDRDGFVSALQDMQRRIKKADGGAGRFELLVYYSGHSDENGLLLGDGRLNYPEFRAYIDAMPARVRVAVVDACASGVLTRLKGGSHLPAFTVDQSSSLSGYAFLTSSSGAEAAQESDRIRASYFTHFLVTGLRGAADNNQDGRVTLAEAYQFAFHETLAQTEASQAGAQHPSYDMRLTGSGDLVLTDLRGTSAGLVLGEELQGRVFLRSAGGALVAELQKPPGRKVELGLEPGLYEMTLDKGGASFRTLVNVEANRHQPLVEADLRPVAREKTRSRGDDPPPAPVRPPQAGEWIPAQASLAPGWGFPGWGLGLSSHHLSMNLTAGKARRVHGLQLSLVGNFAEEQRGLQTAVAFNYAGDARGLQAAFIANAAREEFAGVQAAAGVNVAGGMRGLQMALGINVAGRAQGVQAGALNNAVKLQGVQAGIINVAWEAAGIQAGVLNAAESSRGLQLGLVNMAQESHGIAFGPVNIIGNGLHHLESALDEKSMLRTALILGGPYNYNLVAFDMKGRYPRHLWGWSAGMGAHWPLPQAYTDVDLTGGMLYNEVDWDNLSFQGRMRWLAGWRPLRHFSLFGGLSYNVEAWPGSRFPNLNPGHRGGEWGDARGLTWTGYFLGVRL